MNNMLHLPTKIFLLLIFLFCSAQIFGQSHVLSGTVYDATTHEPLRNANIYNKAENKVSRADSVGGFEIVLSAGVGQVKGAAGTAKVVLVVSMVGYTSKMVVAGTGGQGR